MQAIKKILIGIFVCAVLPAYALPCDPFTVSCRSQDETLTKYPLSTLSMAGTIKDKEDHLWAIIKTPNNHVYPVTVGNFIGNADGKVLEISSQGMIVQQANTHITLELRAVHN